MQIPNKLYSFEESIFSRFPIVLTMIQDEPKTIFEVYKETKPAFATTSDFLETLTALFALGKVTYNDQEELLYYVD